MNTSEYLLTESDLLRRVAQVGQSNIAAALGVSPSLVNDWLSGKKGITFAHIPGLLSVLEYCVIKEERVRALTVLAREGLGE